jgi:hypothetical protein
MTYFGVDTQAEEDPVNRKALETMIKTYGQTPRQLFASSHPAKYKSDIERSKIQEKSKIKVLDSISGLKWGLWCGSPSLSEPSLTMKKGGFILLMVTF